MTVQSLLDRARLPLNDDEKIRYPDTELLAWAVDGVKLLKRKRPDLFVGRWTVSFDALEVGDAVPIDEMYHQMLADYITGRCETKDADFSAEGRGMAFLQLAGGVG